MEAGADDNRTTPRLGDCFPETAEARAGERGSRERGAGPAIVVAGDVED
jgi:hypothetical protein